MTSGSVVQRIDLQYFAEILVKIVPDLPRPVVEWLWSAHRARCYSPAEFLQFEGEPSQGIFLIVLGQVRLSLSKESPRAQRIHYRDVGSPAVLGVSDVMSGSSVSLTAQALTEVQTAFVPKHAFLKAVQLLPQAGLAVSQFIAHDLRSTYSRINELRAQTYH